MVKLKTKYIFIILLYVALRPSPDSFNVKAELFNEKAENVPSPILSWDYELLVKKTNEEKIVTSTKKNVTKLKMPGKIIRDGYGMVDWDDKAGQLVLSPKPPESESDLHSAIFVMDANLKSPYEVSFSMKTLKQLSSDPDSNDVGWFIFGFKEKDKFKYLTLKPEGYGIELGEYLPGGEMVYLYTSRKHAYDFPINFKYDITLRVMEPIIYVTINGLPYFSYEITENDTLSPSGVFGFYTENATVNISNIKWKQLPKSVVVTSKI